MKHWNHFLTWHLLTHNSHIFASSGAIISISNLGVSEVDSKAKNWVQAVYCGGVKVSRGDGEVIQGKEDDQYIINQLPLRMTETLFHWETPGAMWNISLSYSTRGTRELGALDIRFYQALMRAARARMVQELLPWFSWKGSCGSMMSWRGRGPVSGSAASVQAMCPTWPMQPTSSPVFPASDFADSFLFGVSSNSSFYPWLRYTVQTKLRYSGYVCWIPPDNSSPVGQWGIYSNMTLLH